jgi:hypothetical protein
MDAKQIQKNYPSIDPAYQISLATQENDIKGRDAMESKIQGILTFGMTATLALPAFATARGIVLNSNWFYCAIACFLIAGALGVYARLEGVIMLLDPQKLHADGWLRKTEAQFKADIIYSIGEFHEENRKSLLRKSRLLTASTIFFLLEAGFLAAWMVKAAGKAAAP